MISNRCARKSLLINCNSIISKNYLRFLVDNNESFHIINLFLFGFDAVCWILIGIFPALYSNGNHGNECNQQE